MTMSDSEGDDYMPFEFICTTWNFENVRISDAEYYEGPDFCEDDYDVCFGQGEPAVEPLEGDLHYCFSC